MPEASKANWRRLLGRSSSTTAGATTFAPLDPTVPVGSIPCGVAITPDGAHVYVTNDGDGTVSVIDTATNAVSATITVGSVPLGVAITPNGLTAYVTNVGDGTVSIIDTATNTVTLTIDAGSLPASVAITPNGARAYVVNSGDDDVSVVDTATATVTATVPVGNGPYDVAIAPDGLHAYVTNAVDNTISVIGTATNTVTAAIPIGNSPYEVAVTPNGLKGYAANGGDNTVSVVDTATNTVMATIPVGTVPLGVAVAPDGSQVYVTNNGGDDTVSVIDTTADAVIAVIPVGSGPHGVVVTPDGLHAYVANSGDDTVSVTEAAPFNTATVLTSAPDPSVFGQAKTLTANVTSLAGTPTGSVSFFDGATLLGTGVLSGGVATFTTSSLSVGPHALTAVYGGTGNFAGSTSPVDTQTVNQAGTTTALASAPNPSVFGQPVTLTATVTVTAPGAGTPTGSVSFFDGATLVGTGLVSGGVATLTTSAWTLGSHALKAVYNADAQFTGSTSPVITQSVNQAGTTTALNSAPNPSVSGQTITLTASVTAVAPGSGTPTGTVGFFDGATLLGTSVVSGGVALLTTNRLSVGTHNLTALYHGSANFTPSTSPIRTQSVTS